MIFLKHFFDVFGPLKNCLVWPQMGPISFFVLRLNRPRACTKRRLSKSSWHPKQSWKFWTLHPCNVQLFYSPTMPTDDGCNAQVYQDDRCATTDAHPQQRPHGVSLQVRTKCGKAVEQEYACLERYSTHTAYKARLQLLYKETPACKALGERLSLLQIWVVKLYREMI